MALYFLFLHLCFPGTLDQQRRQAPEETRRSPPAPQTSLRRGAPPGSPTYDLYSGSGLLLSPVTLTHTPGPLLIPHQFFSFKKKKINLKKKEEATGGQSKLPPTAVATVGRGGGGARPASPRGRWGAMHAPRLPPGGFPPFPLPLTSLAVTGVDVRLP